MRRPEAFRDFLTYADGHRHWEFKTSKSKGEKNDKRRDHQASPYRSRDAYDKSLYAVGKTNPPTKRPPSANNAPNNPKFPLRPHPSRLETILGLREQIYHDIRRGNGGEKCYFCMTTKAPPRTPNLEQSNADTPVPIFPRHVTTMCQLILGNPVRYGMVFLPLKALRQK